MDSEEDYKSFYDVLQTNCKYKHPGNKLPKVPWFLKSCRNEKIASLLTQLLYDSNFNTEQFLDKATLLLLLHRSEKENQMSQLASLLKENIDIREKLKSIKDSQKKTKGSVRFVSGKSDYGILSITLELGGEYRNLGIGEGFTGTINLKNDVQANVFAEIGEDSMKIDEIFIFFGCALENIYYLSLVDKDSYTVVINKGDERYEVSIEITLFLSDSDKRDILIQHLYENEMLGKKEHETEDLYEILLKQLGIAYQKNEFLSSLVPVQDRSCCGSCEVQ